MREQQPIGELIKSFIKCRNKTLKETAMALGISYTTLSEALIHDTLTAETLFRLAAFLDMDLNWMLVVLGYHGPISSIEREMIPRMQEEFRDVEKKKVEKVLNQLLIEIPDSNSSIRRELKKLYTSTFYLLDVLVPDEFDIYAISTRNGINYHVDTHQIMGRVNSNIVSRRKPISMLLSTDQALDIIIEERKKSL